MIGIIADPIYTLFAKPDPDIIKVEPVAASEEDIMLNHKKSYISMVKRSYSSGHTTNLDSDTVCSERSYEVALLASGGLIKLTEMAIKGEIDSGFAFVRPPGHHATSTAAMGFCLFNNIAIAAKKAMASFGVKKVLIVDFDVHHGNGTQASFYDDDTVLYFSTHQYPFYPGTGALTEIGRKNGEGFTVNCPLSGGKEDGHYIAIYKYILPPIIKSFKPNLILVSAGFDSHAMDPIGGMRLSSSCFGAIGGIIRDTAKNIGAPIVYTLEGGYDINAQKDSVAHIIDIMKGHTPPDIAPTEWPGLDKFIKAHRDNWPL
ncbi:MAG: histone deacetylase [Deltaproteobacteria bacterium]|nr:histone deacetylase [Deltaproteobacteria bacterium]